MFIFPLIATAVAFVFSILLAKQYLDRKKPYQLIWSAAMLMFAIGAGAETFSTLSGWNELTVKLYYLFGATLVVGYLGLGTLYLQEENTGKIILSISLLITLPLWAMIYGKRMLEASDFATPIVVVLIYVSLIILLLVLNEEVGATFLAYLVVVSVVAAYLIFNGVIDSEFLRQTKGWQALYRTDQIRSIAFSLNLIGTFILVLGAIYSGIYLWKNKQMKERAIANLLIAIGVIVVASGGTLGGLFGLGGQAALSLPMTIGIIIMFIGFLQASKTPSVQQQVIEN